MPELERVKKIATLLPTRAARRTPCRVVNDVHSGLNRTRVRSIVRPESLEDLRAVIREAGAARCAIAVAGGRHAMGGQQFARDGVLVDTSSLNRVLRFDPARREVEVEAGIQWPELVNHLIAAQRGRARQFGIIQKQTGADRLSLGGALAANIHGRGLALKPIINDVESFDLVDARGEVVRCSRRENRELFGLAVGGYGLFGVVARVTLRLAPRRKLRRVVRLLDSSELMQSFDGRVAAGFLYGDFQFMTDPDSDGFLRRGVFSCYEPVADDAAEPPRHKELSPGEWGQLLYLAHADRRRAFESYAAHYLSTDGQLYWSDTHQLSVYLDDYHRELDK
ncbi:MAG TPA: FAD-dependent oxidoreductase, partial [Pyrinomonadaceae bacterium]|nr:FAD-dependent oxidoreductase [Pyrinomonadaceae bacterium]